MPQKWQKNMSPHVHCLMLSHVTDFNGKFQHNDLMHRMLSNNSRKLPTNFGTRKKLHGISINQSMSSQEMQPLFFRQHTHWAHTFLVKIMPLIWIDSLTRLIIQRHTPQETRTVLGTLSEWNMNLRMGILVLFQYLRDHQTVSDGNEQCPWPVGGACAMGGVRQEDELHRRGTEWLIAVNYVTSGGSHPEAWQITANQEASWQNGFPGQLSPVCSNHQC